MISDRDPWHVHKIGPRRYGLTYGRTFLGVLDRNTGTFTPDGHQNLDEATIEKFANEVRRRIDDRQVCMFGD
jgi:hypothetical protein